MGGVAGIHFERTKEKNTGDNTVKRKCFAGLTKAQPRGTIFGRTQLRIPAAGGG